MARVRCLFLGVLLLRNDDRGAGVNSVRFGDSFSVWQVKDNSEEHTFLFRVLDDRKHDSFKRADVQSPTIYNGDHERDQTKPCGCGRNRLQLGQEEV